MLCFLVSPLCLSVCKKRPVISLFFYARLIHIYPAPLFSCLFTFCMFYPLKYIKRQWNEMYNRYSLISTLFIKHWKLNSDIHLSSTAKNTCSHTQISDRHHNIYYMSTQHKCKFRAFDYKRIVPFLNHCRPQSKLGTQRKNVNDCLFLCQTFQYGPTNKTNK